MQQFKSALLNKYLSQKSQDISQKMSVVKSICRKVACQTTAMLLKQDFDIKVWHGFLKFFQGNCLAEQWQVSASEHQLRLVIAREALVHCLLRLATQRSTKRQLLRKYSRKTCIEKIPFLVKLHVALPQLATFL